MTEASNITAVILAGGRGSRMSGADKGLIELNGKPLVAHILEQISPQVGSVLINANRNQEIYQQYSYPVIHDELADYQGPLAGFASGMQHARTSHILTLPCDGPEVAADMVQRMISALKQDNAELAVAHDGTRLQPVHALLPVSLLQSLQAFLDNGDRKIDLWYLQHKMALVDFSDTEQMFRNINTPEDRQAFTQPQSGSNA
jgi:molybdenum cofactor guanylyltransferase